MKSSLVCGVIVLVSALSVSGTATTAQVLKFDVVSVKPCDPTAGGGGRGGTSSPASTAHFFSGCQTVDSMIQSAYLYFAGGHVNPPSVRPTFDHQAGPDWIRSERFTIEATTGAETPAPVMRGPMLQAVLEDRFKLKMRRETRDVPVFEAVVAKGGAKLTPFTPGTCVPDVFVVPHPALESGQRWCGGRELNSDGSRVQIVEGMSLDDWLHNIPPVDGRPMVNKTGITGLLTFRFVWPPGALDFRAEIKQLGLELRPAQGPREFLVLDHVERPTPNVPIVPPAHATGPGR